MTSKTIEHEVWSGTGSLNPWGTIDQYATVEYRFDVFTTVVHLQDALPARGQRSTEGKITLQNGETPSEGFYQLIMENGEQHRVQQIMGTSHIVANP